MSASTNSNVSLALGLGEVARCGPELEIVEPDDGVTVGE